MRPLTGKALARAFFGPRYGRGARRLLVPVLLFAAVRGAQIALPAPVEAAALCAAFSAGAMVQALGDRRHLEELEELFLLPMPDRWFALSWGTVLAAHTLLTKTLPLWALLAALCPGRPGELAAALVWSAAACWGSAAGYGLFRRGRWVPVLLWGAGAAAVVVLAALINGAKCLGLELPQVQTVISGAGAAGISICKLLMKAGVRDITLCDRQGAIWEGREGLNGAKTAMAKVTNRAMRKGSLAEVMEGADLFIGVSGPGIVTQEMVRSMSPQAMVFALSNPVPEIMPELALAAGAKVVATGRSDFPNQINNLLVFPGIFKGALAARASRITEEMMIAAAYAIAGRVSPEELSRECIIPSTFDMGVADVVAEAVKAHVEH